MTGPVLSFDDLRRISRLGAQAQLATVERWAKRAGIKYNYDGRGGIWTTVAAMNAAVGLKADAGDSESYSADMVV